MGYRYCVQGYQSAPTPTERLRLSITNSSLLHSEIKAT
jgi:hypothetical protein